MGALNLTQPEGYSGDLQPGWRISETASPLNPASDGDGVGVISLVAPKNDLSPEIILRSGQVSHDTLGTISGTIDQADEGRSAVSLDLVPLGVLLNAERTVPPVIDLTLRQVIETYVAAITDRITVQWQASSNPSRTYPGWTGNVLYMLNRLAMVNKVELIHRDGLLIVRDLGSVTLDVTDVEGLVVKRSTRSSARKTRVTRTAAVGVPTPPQGRKTNYTFDPNSEVVTTPSAWFARTLGGGSFVSTGRSNAATAIAGRSSWYMSIASTGGIFQFGHTFGVAEDALTISRVPSGNPWAFSILFKGPASPRRCAATLQWLNSGGAILREDVIWPEAVRAMGLQTISTTSNTFGGKPAGATRAIFTLYFGITSTGTSDPIAAGDTYFIDNALLTDVADPTYFDTGYPGAVILTQDNPDVARYGLGIATVGLPARTLWNAYEDGNQVFTVEAGKVTRQVIETTSTWISLVQPVYSETAPAAFAGEYAITDSNRLPLTRSEWEGFGGRLTVSTGAKAGELVITLVAPPDNIPGAPGPYSVAASDGQSDYATLSVVGVGVVTTPETIEVFTGANEADTTVDYAPDVASPFITTYDDLYEAGAWSGQINGGLEITLEGRIPTDKLAGFGLTPGALVLHRNCRYRVRTVDIDRVGASIVADWYVTMADHDAAVAGLTQANLDTIWGAKRVIDYEIAPLRTN